MDRDFTIDDVIEFCRKNRDFIVVSDIISYNSNIDKNNYKNYGHRNFTQTRLVGYQEFSILARLFKEQNVNTKEKEIYYINLHKFLLNKYELIIQGMINELDIEIQHEKKLKQEELEKKKKDEELEKKITERQLEIKHEQNPKPTKQKSSFWDIFR